MLHEGLHLIIRPSFVTVIIIIATTTTTANATIIITFMLASAVMPRLAALYLKRSVEHGESVVKNDAYLSHFARSAASVGPKIR